MIGSIRSAVSPFAFLLLAMIGMLVAGCSSPEERAKAHYQSGLELLEKQDFARAGVEFRNAIKLNDKLADAWFGLSQVSEKSNDWPAVQTSLQRVVELDTKHFDAHFKLAKLLLATMNLDSALKTINTANELKGNDSGVLALRGSILFRLNDREGARADAEKSLAINPDNADAHAVLAADQMVDGKPDAALQFIERGLKADAGNLGLLLFKLKIYDEKKDYPNVEAVLRRIVEVAPDNREIHRALVRFLVSRDRPADAEAEMRVMADASPDDVDLALDVVRFISDTSGTEASRKELERLVAAKPQITVYRLSLAQLDFAEKKTDAAIAAVNAIIAKGEPKEDVHKAQLLLAAMQIDLGKNDEAKKIVDAVLEADGKNADGLAIRAKLKLDADDADGAVSDLREALGQKPKQVQLIAMLAKAHERQGAIDLAAERYAEAVRVSNFDPRITLEAIAFLNQRNRRELAENLLTEAVAARPDDRRFLLALGDAKLNRQDWAGAQDIADTLKKLGDTSSLTNQLEGAILFGQNKFDESIESLKGAVAINPKSMRPVQGLVLAYVKAGKIDEAETFVESLLSANNDNAEAHILLGSLKAMKKLPQEAETHFKTAVEKQPNAAAGYLALGKHLASQSRMDEAEATFKSGRQKAPGDVGLSLALAGLLEQKKDVDGAIAIYEEQFAATPDALVIANNLASLLADNRTDAASLDRAQQVARTLEAVEVPHFMDTVGWVAYLRGDHRTAAAKLEQASAKLPKFALVRYHLGMTYSAMKKVAEAQREFEAAMENAGTDEPLKKKIAAAQAALKPAN